ncbi:MAG TPA: hypothetical protein VK149_10550 [Sideroxyarcus sp.]|nr:hypothetical protein [Sideroxyarcus sp.]
MATGLKRISAALSLVLACAVHAEVLPDPTRPAAEAGQSSADTAAGVRAEPGDDGLRTIIISQDRRSAVINGRQVSLGGMLGEEQLMAVCEDGVVLQGSEGRRRVSLYPGVEMRGERDRRCNKAATPANEQLNKTDQKTTSSVAGK